MSYPNLWMQTSLDLPGGKYPFNIQEPKGTWNQWWAVDRDFPSSFNYQDFADEWMFDFVPVMDTFLAGTIPIYEQASARFWWMTQFGPNARVSHPGGIGWTNWAGQNAPSILQVQFKAIHQGLQTVRARKYLGPVTKVGLSGTEWTPTITGGLDGFCYQMTNSYTRQGVKFTPVMASRKYHDFFSYTNMTWRTPGLGDSCILGTCKRRGRLNWLAAPPPSTPLPLP